MQGHMNYDLKKKKNLQSSLLPNSLKWKKVKYPNDE